IFPQYVSWDPPGIPMINVHNYPTLLAFTALILGTDRRLYRFQWIDLLVVALIGLGAASNHVNQDFAAAKNYFALEWMAVASPYFIGKAITRSNGLLAGSLLVLVSLGAFVGYVCLWETRMSKNLFFTYLGFQHGGHFEGRMPVLFRYGLMRAGGPFHHPIFIG